MSGNEDSSHLVVLEVCRLESEGYYCEEGFNKRTDNLDEASRFTDAEADEIIKTRIHQSFRVKKIELTP